MEKEGLSRVKVTKYFFSSGKEVVESDSVALEALVSLYLNEKLFRVFSATPLMLRELVAGQLYTTGYINRKEEIQKIKIENNKIYVSLSEALSNKFFSIEKSKFMMEQLGLKPVKGNLKLKVETVARSVDYLNEVCFLFKRTGGVHCALVMEDEEPIVHAEDVSRHNACDKVIGYCFLNRINLKNKMLVFSGRMSLEIVFKACVAKIPVIISVSGPLSGGIELARKMGITLIGFVREGKMNVYTHENRVIF